MKLRLKSAVAAAAIFTGALAAPVASGTAAGESRGMALMSASVAADGSVLHASGVVNVEPLETGFLEVTFARNIKKCDLVVSHASASRQTLSGFALVGAKRSGARKIVVFTVDPGSATPENHPFSVIAFCAG